MRHCIADQERAPQYRSKNLATSSSKLKSLRASHSCRRTARNARASTSPPNAELSAARRSAQAAAVTVGSPVARQARPSGGDCGGLTRVTGHGLQSLAERSWETLHAWQGACMRSQGRRGLTAWSVKELN